MRPIFILGAAGHARDVADVADACGYRPVFVSPDMPEIAAWRFDDEIVHHDDAIGRTGEAFAIGIGDNRVRARVAAGLSGLDFPTLIHPQASFGRGQRAVVAASRGSVVFAGVRFTSAITLGSFCTFNLNASVSHDCEIGDFVNLSPGAAVAGNVRIGAGAWIGINAAVNQGTDATRLTIGANTVIGSGAVVLGDCDPDSTYVGVPARKLA